MQTINMHEAKTHLSHLMMASQGESFMIAKAGKSLVKVLPIELQDIEQTQCLGFMLGECQVPDNFDTMLRDEIQALLAQAATEDMMLLSADNQLHAYGFSVMAV